MSKNESVTVNNNDASRLTINIIYVIALVGSVAGIMFSVTNERNNIYNKIDSSRQEMQQQLVKVSNTLTNIQSVMERFNSQLKNGTDDRYTRKDAALDCAKSALSNPGFICHNPLSPEPQFYSSGLGKWETRVKR